MQDDEFEWHDLKAALNWKNHRITFIQATAVFRDNFAVERIDEREDYGEERINRIGHCGGLILVVTYTMRGHRKRIISARRAEIHEADFLFSQGAAGGGN